MTVVPVVVGFIQAKHEPLLHLLFTLAITPLRSFSIVLSPSLEAIRSFWTDAPRVTRDRRFHPASPVRPENMIDHPEKVSILRPTMVVEKRGIR
jgi:hypothetical protein